MRPILFVIPGLNLQVHGYGVMIFLACAAALAVGVWGARRQKVNENSVYELATWLFLGGVIGARAMYVLFHTSEIHGVGDIFRTWQGGNVFYGCILGGFTGSMLYWLRRPFPFWAMCDVAAPSVAIGAAVGRIGCFLNGCCDGAMCSLPWGVRFPAGSHAWTRQVNAGLIAPSAPYSVPVHPTQVYAALAAFLVLGLLLLYYPRQRRQGEIMALLMIFYPLTRWPIECLRGDEPALFAGMTLAQIISVALLASGVAVWLFLKPAIKGQTAPEPALSSHHRLDAAHTEPYKPVRIAAHESTNRVGVSPVYARASNPEPKSLRRAQKRRS
jgi:phosphatidylglycerol:prolipoprotein diacylglycerol transferase